VQRFAGPEAVPADWPRSVVTVGVFDGVHLGHRAIVAQARERARAAGMPVVAITFDPHPSEIVRPGTHPAMLSTLDDRVALLGEAGADAVLVLPFTWELSQHTPERFVREVVTGSLHASAVVVGSNFRFGHRALGTVDTLRELGDRLGFEVEAVGLVGGPAVSWSSTYVRQCVLEGDVAEAAEILDRPHRVVGTVVHGDHRGRELGYPTANLALVEHSAVPADGVYAGRLVVAGEHLPAAVSIGTNPTFDGVAHRVEAYVLDRDDLDLYGHRVACEFVARLRPTVRFDSADALVEQMADDVAQARVRLTT
jgi:riboflavin kinase/FMN adenylyltransferase